MKHARKAIIFIAICPVLVCIEMLRMPQYPVGIRQYEEADTI
jgi:hypothetical protein